MVLFSRPCSGGVWTGRRRPARGRGAPPCPAHPVRRGAPVWEGGRPAASGMACEVFRPCLSVARSSPERAAWPMPFPVPGLSLPLPLLGLSLVHLGPGPVPPARGLCPHGTWHESPPLRGAPPALRSLLCLWVPPAVQSSSVRCLSAPSDRALPKGQGRALSAPLLIGTCPPRDQGPSAPARARPPFVHHLLHFWGLSGGAGSASPPPLPWPRGCSPCV